ncbi:hypothetical protein AAFP35_08225 [Gordonia sp. CPCC 206044]|uniref:hypothetical protein n=1 Tax=Gordonia sp. CPCC 206044 TaxID=3140793 RepID=UPI003AF38009
MTTSSLLEDAQDCYGFVPAVTIDDDVVDFERFAECVEWLTADLQACGVSSGSRVGLGVQSGWALVLTWHALVAIDAVVVPMDLCDEDSVEQARALDLDFVLAHRAHDNVLEDVIDELIDEATPPCVYRVAEEFALVGVGDEGPGRPGGGGLVTDLDSGRVERADHLLAEAERIGRRLDLWPGVRVRLCGALNTRPAMLLIIACAARGACACVEASSVPTGDTAIEVVPVIDRPESEQARPLLSVVC